MFIPPLLWYSWNVSLHLHLRPEEKHWAAKVTYCWKNVFVCLSSSSSVFLFYPPKSFSSWRRCSVGVKSTSCLQLILRSWAFSSVTTEQKRHTTKCHLQQKKTTRLKFTLLNSNMINSLNSVVHLTCVSILCKLDCHVRLLCNKVTFFFFSSSPAVNIWSNVNFKTGTWSWFTADLLWPVDEMRKTKCAGWNMLFWKLSADASYDDFVFLSFFVEPKSSEAVRSGRRHYQRYGRRHVTADIKRVVSVLQFTQADIESIVAQSAQRPEVLRGRVCFVCAHYVFPTNQIKTWRKEKPDTCLRGEMMNFLLFLFFPLSSMFMLLLSRLQRPERPPVESYNHYRRPPFNGPKKRLKRA